MKRKPSIELPDGEDAVELSLSSELTGEAFGTLFHKEAQGFDKRKWSSLTFSLLMHCALAVVLCYAVKTGVPANSPWIRVQLVVLNGGSTGQGSGSPAPAAAVSEGPDRPEGPSSPVSETFEVARSEEADPPAPETHETAPPEESVPPVPVTHETMSLPIPEKPVIPDHPPEQIVKPVKTPPVPPVKDRKPKKAAHPVACLPKEEPAGKRERNEDKAVTEAGTGNGRTSAESSGSGEGGGAGTPASQPGNGESRQRSHGPVEVAFGAPGGPRFRQKVMPVYPPFARKQEREGTVLLRVIIDEEGKVTEVEVLKKAGSGFDEAAVKAIRESTFTPAKIDGKSLCCKALIPIRFQLTTSDIY